ncbi:MAG: hypothetical protein QM820_06805 [Minicystis sp.]
MRSIDVLDPTATCGRVPVWKPNGLMAMKLFQVTDDSLQGACARRTTSTGASSCCTVVNVAIAEVMYEPAGIPLRSQRTSAFRKTLPVAGARALAVMACTAP